MLVFARRNGVAIALASCGVPHSSMRNSRAFSWLESQRSMFSFALVPYIRREFAFCFSLAGRFRGISQKKWPPWRTAYWNVL